VKRPVVIAGGGLAGQRFAETLRRQGFDGPLLMVCAEPVAPYDRPPLSKELLAGVRSAESLRLRDDAWYRDNDVELRLGARAVGIDPERRAIELSDGARVRYDRMLVATGAVPRVPAQLHGFDNVLTLRDLPDALALAQRLRPGARLVVVGAGFVGLEVASTALSLGAEVTIVEAAPAPLSGPLGPQVGTWFARWHRSRGAAVHVGARIARVHGARSVRELELADGTRLAADVVLAAIGAAPDTAWLARAGLPAGGVAAGHGGATGVPGILAAGDATGHLHWEAAARHGADAARVLLGKAPAPEAPGGFWSDQHGVRFQLVGDTAGTTATTVDGDLDACDFSITYWNGNQPAAILLAGRPAALASARRAIQPTRNAA
jgi:3-phenylpropionate/trans-cinnamate dioxygenase ferredoxin reductase component